MLKRVYFCALIALVCVGTAVGGGEASVSGAEMSLVRVIFTSPVVIPPALAQAACHEPAMMFIRFGFC